MSEVPHCPGCRRADTVRVADAHGSQYDYVYVCTNYTEHGERPITPDKIDDASFLDITAPSMYPDPDAAEDRAKHDYSDECKCQWCEKGRPDIEKIDPSEVLTREPPENNHW